MPIDAIPAIPDAINRADTLVGHAALDPLKQSSPSTYLVYWRKPEEWGQMIYDWVMDHGLASSIMTFYEITDGDMAETMGESICLCLDRCFALRPWFLWCDAYCSTEFRQMPVPLLRKSLDILVKKGKAQIIRGEGDSGDGARFF